MNQEIDQGAEPARRHGITEGQGTVGGLRMCWLEAGPVDGPLAICQHGFPDTPWGWRWLLPALAGAGFRAVAPYARGYAPSEVPPSHISALSGWVADICDLHDQLGGDHQGVIVGHDWGAMAAYGAAALAPERWRAVVTASVPPASVMGARLLSFDQVKAFWYQYVFLQPTAEAIVSSNNLEFLERLWREWSPSFDPSAEIGRVKAALGSPANLTAALGTYRSMYDLSLQPPELAEAAMAILSPHPQPTLYLHGTDDGCVPNLDLSEVLGALPAGSAVEAVEGAGHFLQYEAPRRVTDLVIDFLSCSEGAP